MAPNGLSLRGAACHQPHRQMAKEAVAYTSVMPKARSTLFALNSDLAMDLVFVARAADAEVPTSTSEEPTAGAWWQTDRQL